MRRTRPVSRPGIDTPRIIAFALFALGVLAALSGIVLLVAPSRFEAVATITANPAHSKTHTLETRIELLRSETVLNRALQQLHAARDAGTHGETIPRIGPQDISELRRRLKITPSRNTIHIRVTARDPETAADTANAIVAGYSSYLTGVIHSLKEQELETLRARVEEGRQQLEKANQMLLDVGRNLGLSNASPELVELAHPTYMEAIREYRRLEESVASLEANLKARKDALLETPEDPLLAREEATPEFRPVGPNRTFGAAALALGAVLLLAGAAALAVAKRRLALRGL